MGFDFGDRDELPLIKAEIAPRSRLLQKLALSSNIPKMVSLSHLQTWHFDPFSFDWKKNYGLLVKFNESKVIEYLSIFGGSFRTVVREKYLHIIARFAVLNLDLIFFSQG